MLALPERECSLQYSHASQRFLLSFHYSTLSANTPNMATIQTTDDHANSPLGVVAPSEVRKIGTPEFEAHVHAHPLSQNTGIIEPSAEVYIVDPISLGLIG